MWLYTLSTQELLDLENAKAVELANLQKDLIQLDQMIDGVEVQKISII